MTKPNSATATNLEVMTLAIPELALVLLIGASAAIRRGFAAKHFGRRELLTLRQCRALLGEGRTDAESDDANTDGSDKRAAGLLQLITGLRLEAKRLTVVDVESIRPKARQKFVHLAKQNEVKPVAVVFPGRLSPSIEKLTGEGFKLVHLLPSAAVDVAVQRVPLPCNRRTDSGPFDIIGDVHGCIDDLERLLQRLEYKPIVDSGQRSYRHPHGRRVIFLGDLCDRGPATPRVLDLVMTMVERGDGLCVPGNHDAKLVRKLRGENVKVSHGLAESLEQLSTVSPDGLTRIMDFVDGLPSHLVLDGGRLVVAHAGMKECYQGRSSGRVLAFALYGETTGEHDDFGLPVRLDWAADYRGSATVVYGHTPVPQAVWHNDTICIDTGCVFGGHLTALRYPERDLVSTKAGAIYYRPVKPLTPIRPTVDAAGKSVARDEG